METKHITKILDQINKSVDSMKNSNMFVQTIELNIIQNYVIELEKELLEIKNEEN